MKTIVGIRFNTGGKVYFFDPAGLTIERGMHVIVDTAKGMEYGTAVDRIREIEDEKLKAPLKPVLRIATERDDKQNAENREKEKDAVRLCKQKIKDHGLEMKLIEVEYTFDRSKIIFYFTADGRVDFRELVKDLASLFHTRIELRQIGVRDATRMIGGIGTCGRELCCHSYMTDFIPVSIKMAKEQNLSLNPGKISGMCGRLMCCLQYEADTYAYLNRNLPGNGDTVTTPLGIEGKVASVDVLRQRVKVIVEENDSREIEEYHVDELKFIKRRKGKKENENLTEEELKELKKLEAVDITEGEEKPKQQKKENRENREKRDNRENRDNRDKRENRENRDNREDRDNKENKDNKDNRKKGNWKKNRRGDKKQGDKQGDKQQDE
ncbi:MAG: stage 0 sporulation protein [Lachnospiraceae bacterium]|nr:stage 0 sporulation protein [Lachnospiraceae bacterium]